MKNIYLAYFLLIMLSACNDKQSDMVSLQGEIKGLGNDTIYIYGADEMYDHMDTLLVENDKFSGMLSTDTLASTWLLFGNGMQYPLFIDKGNKIQINGSTTEINSLTISGNTPNEELSAFQKKIKGLSSSKAIEEKAEEFINEHPSSLASIYLLDMFFVQKKKPDYNQIKKLTEPMTGELKDRTYIRTLLERIQEENKADKGKIAAYFHLPNTEGEQINRSKFKDKYLLIHFWASWDSVSRDSNAVYRKIYKQVQKSKKFALLGVSLDTDKADWQKAIETDSLEWEQVCDLSGWNTEIAKQFAVKTLPANVLLTPTGRIEDKNMSKLKIEKRLKDIEKEESKDKENDKKRIKKRR